MSEFWKLKIGEWNVETDDLTLEQEAAYLRVRNAIQLYDQPIRDNLRVLSGLWRCNERKAKRLRQELIDAGLILPDDGFLTNETAMNDVSNRRELRVERASSGRRGGIQSGKTRAKALETNEPDQATGSTRREEKRREENPPKPPKGGGMPSDEFEEWWALYPRKVAKGQARRAFAKARKKVDLETLAKSVRRFSAKMQGKEAEFIAHASTWLNGERWADEEGVSQPAITAEQQKNQAELRIARAKEWLTRNDTIPDWMDSRQTAEALLAEGYDYDRLKAAGFSVPERGNVVRIGGAAREIGQAMRAGHH